MSRKTTKPTPADKEVEASYEMNIRTLYINSDNEPITLADTFFVVHKVFEFIRGLEIMLDGIDGHCQNLEDTSRILFCNVGLKEARETLNKLLPGFDHKNVISPLITRQIHPLCSVWGWTNETQHPRRQFRPQTTAALPEQLRPLPRPYYP